MKPDDSDNHWPRGPRDLARVFRRVAEDVFAGLDLRVVRREGWDYSLSAANGDKKQQVNLHNLYLRACRADRDQWPELVRDFLANLDTSPYDSLTDRPLAELAGQLMPRVGLPFTGTGDIRPWTQPLGDTGLVANLVIDLPKSMMYVNSEKVADSGRSAGEWFATALDNLRKSTPDDAFRLLDAESGLFLCDTNDSYDAARSLVVERLLGTGPAGCLVAVPSRDLLVAMPVTLDRMPHFHLVKVVAEKAHQNAPYAVSDQVFWVRDGVWRKFPVRLTPGNVTVSPPAEFLEALNALSPADGEDDGSADND